MTTADHEWPTIRSVEVDDHWITATFADGRRVGLPLSWSWRLEQATQVQRDRWELIADGVAIHWPDVDEDLSARGFFVGRPAPRPCAKSS
jgi:flavin reductase (DIM6/NTAB) family NADH-FMN oxidoreductase RutF